MVAAAAAALNAAELTHGPILGRVGAGRIGVWVRTDRPAPFQVRFGSGPDRLDRQSPLGTTALEHDNFRNTVGNCDFFFLDTRSHRELHDVRDAAKPGLSMLGKPQREWLEHGMQKSAADFLFVISSVNFMVPHKGGGAVRAENKDDAWTVFLDERERLIRFFDSLGKPVFVLTGDLHNSFVVKITERVWEFASGPHNSQNHLASDEGDRPANGPFVSGPRTCDIRWSTYFLPDVPRKTLQYPTYCVVQVNNVFNNPLETGRDRWVAYPRPQVIFQYFDGLTGKLRYSETIVKPATGQ